MLSKFSVSGYKSFKDKVEIDFKSGKFDFNQEAVSTENSLVKTAIIYGKNGTGKSNLGFAIFDIVTHLTDNNTNKEQRDNILNLNSKSKYIEFSYEFSLLKGKKVKYKYTKDGQGQLVRESLELEGCLVLGIDRQGDSKATISLKGAETLIKDFSNAKNISIINYVKNNSVLDKRDRKNKLFYELISFVNHMLYFKSLDKNAYIGYESGNGIIVDDILKNNKLKDFEKFLNKAGVKCELINLKTPSGPTMGFKFDNGVREFYDVASTGTKALAVFYYWFMRMERDKYPFFVFIDEFDAFYHYSLSALIIEQMKKLNKQVVCTTHNTDIMSNELLRPDCYYIMTDCGINQITKCTEKELREVHNLSKLYKAGSFNCER